MAMSPLCIAITTTARLALVEIPHRRFAEPDDAAGGQPALVDAPPAQLTPVEQIRIVRLHDVGGPEPLTAEDPQRQLCRRDALRGEVEEAAADGAATEHAWRHRVDRYA